MSMSVVQWQPGNWAFKCDFIGNDFFTVKSEGQYCTSKCELIDDCTHFTWNMYDGGTCYFKKGDISPEDAIDSEQQSIVCGYIDWKIKKKGTINIQILLRVMIIKIGTNVYIFKKEIYWRAGNWAFSCKFGGNRLVGMYPMNNITSFECRNNCQENLACTHFEWTDVDNGSCLLKTGYISRDKAIYNDKLSIICGITRYFPINDTITTTTKTTSTSSTPDTSTIQTKTQGYFTSKINLV